MKTNTINKILYSNKIYKILGLIAVGMCCIMVIGVLTTDSKDTKTKKQTETIYEPDHLTMSQLKMKEAYGWKEIVLWKESKENFEKAYGKKLQHLDLSLSFKMNTFCCEPYGCSGNWDMEKMCFEYIIMTNMPDELYELSNKSYGKTLVVIGNTYRLNDVERFVGQSWWCE
jgi:hypothetical protein